MMGSRVDSIVFQEDFADCGLACLSMVAKHHGRNYDLAMLKRNFPTSIQGAGLIELLAIAGQLGFTTRAVRVEVDALHTLKLPLLLHWGFNHYVILSRCHQSKFWILDPVSGKRILNVSDISRFFSGVAVEFSVASELHHMEGVAKVSILDIFLSVNNSIKRIGLCILLALLSYLGIFMFPLFLRAIMEISIYPSNISSIFIVVGTAMILSIFFSFASFLKHKIANRLSDDIDLVLASFLNKLVFSISYEFFLRKTPGLVARYFQNLRRIRQIVSEGIIDAIVDSIAVIVIVGSVILINPLLGLILILALITYVIIVCYMQRNRESLYRRSAALDNVENIVLMDNLRNVQAIKLNGLEDVRDVQWQTAYRRSANSLDALSRLSVHTELSGNAMLGLIRCVLVGVAAWLVLQNSLSLAAFVSFSLYQAFLTLSVSNLMRRLIGLWDIRAILRDLSTLLMAERDPMIRSISKDSEDFEYDGDKPHKAFAPQLNSSIVLTCHNVCFRFDNASRWLLNNVSFTLNRGDLIAITGSSGAGKSTLLRVVTGLLKPSSGEIAWLGASLDHWTRSELVKQVATVMQEDQIFTGTILQNITHFSPDPDMKKLDDICASSGISLFANRLKMGLHTPVTSNSTLLSVGEKQRIFLARALYLGADTLLLDEFTGNLDMNTELYIFEQLRKLGKTVVMTAHRQSTIDQANRVFELDSSGNLTETKSTSWANEK